MMKATANRAFTTFTITAVLVTALAISLVSLPAVADDSLKLNAVQVGGDWLTNSTARDGTSSIGIYLGYSRRLPTRSLISPDRGWAGIDLDWDHNSGHSNKLESFGLSYVERIPFSHANGGTVPYYGVGIGGFYDRLSVGTSLAFASVGSAAATSGDPTDHQFRIGGKALVGASFSDRYFAELSYRMSGKIQGVRTDTVNLAIGTRF